MRLSESVYARFDRVAYPDLHYPHVRSMVDSYAARLGWRRRAQADFVAIFQTTEINRSR